MKRYLSLASVIILATTCLSAQSALATDAPKAMKAYEAALQLVQPAPAEDSAEAMKAYKAVLRNEVAFCNVVDKKKYTLKDLKDESNASLEVISFTVVDMDSDGKPEVVLDFGGPHNNVVLLHYEDGKVYGVVIPYTYYLAKDGTYNGSLQAWDFTYCKVTSITKDNYKVETLARVEANSDRDGDNQRYYISELKVTKDKYDAFVQRLLDKRQENEATWHDFTDENIASAFWVAHTQMSLPVTSASLSLTDPAAIKYASILNSYWDYFIHHDGNDDAIDDLFGRIAKEVKIEPNIKIPKAYELKNSFEPLEFASSGINLGYSLRDLNNDGIPELFIISEDYSIHAIFSLLDDGPVLLGGYWSRNLCEVDEAGTFYNSGSGGASDSSSASYSYVGGHELRLTRMVGMETFDENAGKSLPEPRYYRIESGVKTIIDEKEAEADPLWGGVFPKKNALNLNFTPLFSIPPVP